MKLNGATVAHVHKIYFCVTLLGELGGLNPSVRVRKYWKKHV